MEIVRTPEQERHIRIAQLEQEIREIENQKARLEQLVGEKKVTGGTTNKVLASIAEYEGELVKKHAELKELIGDTGEGEVAM